MARDKRSPWDETTGSLMDQTGEPAQFLECEDVLYAEQNFDSSLVHRDAQHERSLHAFAEVRWIFDIAGRKIEHLADAIDNQSDHRLFTLLLHLHHDNAGGFGERGVRKGELEPKINYGNDLSAQIQ